MIDKNNIFKDGCFFSKKRIESPEEVIKVFYDIWTQEDVNITLWRLFKGAMGSENPAFINPDEEISKIIFFLETFLMLNMAVYELNLRIRKQ